MYVTEGRGGGQEKRRPNKHITISGQAGKPRKGEGSRNWGEQIYARQCAGFCANPLSLILALALDAGPPTPISQMGKRRHRGAPGSSCMVILFYTRVQGAPQQCSQMPRLPLFPLSRKASQGAHRDGLDPLVPVLHPHPDHIWEEETPQWRSAVLGPVARRLLLDAVHDRRGLPGVLCPSGHHQVRGPRPDSHGSAPGSPTDSPLPCRPPPAPSVPGGTGQVPLSYLKLVLSPTALKSRKGQKLAFSECGLWDRHCVKWLTATPLTALQLSEITTAVLIQ